VGTYKLKKLKSMTWALMLIALLAVAAAGCTDNKVEAASELPVKGMVTMIDLGADRCIPCKLMAPILAHLQQKYKGRAAIVFVDVWKDPRPARRFKVRIIPTQIFFNQEGREVYRHQGFLDKDTIEKILSHMGVRRPAEQG